jgi:hypothetical protein
MVTKNAGCRNIHKPKSRLPKAIIGIITAEEPAALFLRSLGMRKRTRVKIPGSIKSTPKHITMKGIACSRSANNKIPIAAVTRLRTHSCSIVIIFKFKLEYNPIRKFKYSINIYPNIRVIFTKE